MSQSVTDDTDTDAVEKFEVATEEARDSLSNARSYALIWDTCGEINRDTEAIEIQMHERMTAEIDNVKGAIDRMEETDPATSDD